MARIALIADIHENVVHLIIMVKRTIIHSPPGNPID